MPTQKQTEKPSKLWNIPGFVCAASWTVAYVLYVQQARRDTFYGMPLPALIFNLAWEYIYTIRAVLYPSHVGQLLYITWCIIDTVLLFDTVKYGAKEWVGSSPLFIDNYAALVYGSLLFVMVGHWYFGEQFNKNRPTFWSAMFCQNLLSWGSILMLLTRNHTGGHSLTIWAWRFLGLICALTHYGHRIRTNPTEYAANISGPFSVFIRSSAFIADVTYPFVYMAVSNASKA